LADLQQNNLTPSEKEYLKFASFKISELEKLTRQHECWVHFSGDINTGTWPTKLGESQMRQ
jgi:hypothetical protein